MQYTKESLCLCNRKKKLTIIKYNNYITKNIKRYLVICVAKLPIRNAVLLYYSLVINYYRIILNAFKRI